MRINLTAEDDSPTRVYIHGYSGEIDVSVTRSEVLKCFVISLEGKSGNRRRAFLYLDDLLWEKISSEIEREIKKLDRIKQIKNEIDNETKGE